MIEPLVAAVGQPTVQRYLISVIQAGPAHKKVCAMRAWYWSQVTLVYESSEAYEARRPTLASQAAFDEVAELRDLYRIACLNAFVAVQHTPTRERLANGFLLTDDRYPPNQHHLVAQAIAAQDPHRYSNLLTKQDDQIGLSQIGLVSK
jgi:hypothetical protein